MGGTPSAMPIAIAMSRVSWREHALAYDLSPPQRVEQLLLAHDPVRIFHQVFEQVEGLRLQAEHGVGKARSATSDVKRKLMTLEAHWMPGLATAVPRQTHVNAAGIAARHHISCGLPARGQSSDVPAGTLQKI
jgi:hypothetical protein